jgi:hypothetical protein
MNNDIESAEPIEQEERLERQGKGLARIETLTFSSPDHGKPKPAIVDTQHHRPTLPPPRKLRDTEAIMQKRQELERLELELRTSEREREALENRLEGVEREITTRTRELSKIASECARVEDKTLQEQFVLLFRKSLYGGLDAHDVLTFSRVGLMLSNRKLLMAALTAEAKELDDQLALLETEAAELREKLDFDAETESL